jgi:hypothetical protein
MGYAIDEMRPELIVFGDDVNEELMEATSFSDLKSKYDQKQAVKEYAHFQLNFIYQMLNKIQDEQSLLLVSHGLIIDLPLVVMFPDENHGDWGEIFSYCEGYRVKYDGKQFFDLELLRV